MALAICPFKEYNGRLRLFLIAVLTSFTPFVADVLTTSFLILTADETLLLIAVGSVDITYFSISCPKTPAET